MGAFTYLLPVVIFAGMGLFYLNIYRKGKAAGGGLMAGFQVHQHDRWRAVLEPGEVLRVWGTGLLWRPWWQYELARQIPLFRLIWPVKTYEMVLTDRARMLVGRYSVVGTLSEQKAYSARDVRLEGFAEEKPGLASKLNPLVPKDYRTFQGTFVTSDGPLKLCGVPGNFVDGLRS
jgi:hypothetical protein